MTFSSGRDNERGELWEHLGSEVLLETPYFKLRTDRLRLPDGVVKDSYYVIERQDAVFVLAVTESGEVPLVRQYRPPLKQMELCLPAGLVDEGEEPFAAARRELLEETGYSGGEWELVTRLSSSPGLKANWAHVYLARGVEPVASLDLDEFERLEVVNVPLERLGELVRSGEIISSSGVAGILLALERLGEG
ncbi:NUDIX domain [Rubrobacter radiotolerans]|uniref:NUDIX domain n=1 Tax=Rubrobacter radiotolerans TaxID=42256 RepID=A0A023X5T6_RUBRA|nr:NUDIX hydrolase [Rubrobacter radiotolerans]AHY47698.1 NUDIX domain [Rubrobacter radiotolerans]MDX5895101.1 NUDIX hydrolase [Rubrobacter radiotolerans]SMC07455.1 ADP-ribose pyrophosphatase [Rubrobacter radiotolerans DSM 5868]